MKNILIISFFHSSQHHVGAIRTKRFAQYLPDFGWKPYVLTKLPLTVCNGQTLADGGETFYAPSIPLNKPFHLESLIWVPFMSRKAINLLRKIPIEVVLISCPPFHQAIAGILLKKWFGIKLVIDYRDAWGLNPYCQHLSSIRRFMLQGDKFLEHCLLRNTDLLIVSHQSMKDNYLKRFRFLENRTEVVYNGFDLESIGFGESDLFSEFTILHLGDFYDRQRTRDPRPFLSAVQEIIAQKKIPTGKFRVTFIGERYIEIEREIQTKGLSSYVSYLNRVPQGIAMVHLKRSHMLLLIEKMDVMTTKVFEYLSTGKPILCLAKENTEMVQLMRKFSSNSYIINWECVDEIRESILKCYEDYQLEKCKPAPNEEFIRDFNRMEQTRRLSDSINRILYC